MGGGNCSPSGARPVASRHVCVDAQVADEDETFGIEVELAVEPVLPPLHDVGAVSLARGTVFDGMARPPSGVCVCSCVAVQEEEWNGYLCPWRRSARALQRGRARRIWQAVVMRRKVRQGDADCVCA